ncbi:MAG: insulinase family protein [Thermoguttaceae bacterium]|nr:insulinase family protein [Thermoguttaceae bacterium]
MKFHRTTLDNGLEIIAEENESALSTSLGFFVKTGSRDETDEISGVSHFLEHMVFKGTERRDAERVNIELDELGGVSNAFTSEETTAFYVKVLPELQERAVDLLSDIMRPSLRPDDFSSEKKVILEEIKMYEDKPPFGIDEKCREYFWAGHPLARSVAGTIESVEGITRDAMREYFERRYSPSNIVFAACGQLNFDQITSWVSHACSGWRAYDAPRVLTPIRGRRGTQTIQRDGTSLEYVLQLVDSPTLRDPDRIASSLLSTVLGDDVGSRLFWELVDTGAAESADIFPCRYLDAGFMATSLVCKAEDVGKNLATIRDLLADAASGGVTEEELQRAKNKWLTSIALAGERPLSRLFGIASRWLAENEYRSISEILETIRQTTLDEVNESQKKYPYSDPFTIAVGELDRLSLS